jgi:hypothetical protein
MKYPSINTLKVKKKKKKKKKKKMKKIEENKLKGSHTTSKSQGVTESSLNIFGD